MTTRAPEHTAKAEATRSRRILVIFNPASGRRRRRRFNATLRCLRALGCDCTVRETGGPGDAGRIARSAVRGCRPEDGYDAVVAAGGDGTVNEVVCGLAGSGMPLGIVPLGTANVLAAEIGLPKRPQDLAAVIARGPARAIHVGEANGHRFVMMAGIGFDARVVAAVGIGLKRRLGTCAYIWRSLVELLRNADTIYRVTVGRKRYEAASVIIANGHYYGGRLVAAADARLEMPTLHVVLFERPGRWNTLRYVVATLFGRLARLRDVRILVARRLGIDGPADDPVQGDGDIIARLPVKVRLAQETQPVLRPE